MKRITTVGFALLVASAIIGGIWLAIPLFQSQFKRIDGFSEILIDLPVYDLNDVGVVDVNNDDYIDIYTVNHSSRQGLLLSDNGSRFIDRFAALGLSHDYLIADIENSDVKPEFDQPGYYIYLHKKKLTIESHKASSLSNLRGSLKLAWPLMAQETRNSEVKIVNYPVGKVSQLTFSVGNEDTVWVSGENEINELPHHIELDQQTDLNTVFIGHQRINPQTHDINLMWRDRHSMLWTDFDRDQDMDVFIGRGGVKGRLLEVPEDIQDEIFLQNDEKMLVSQLSSGMGKDACPVRQSALVDYDNDNDLDLYMVCGRGEHLQYPNRLYEKIGVNQYVDRASDLGLDYPGEAIFKWIDVNNDSRPDLITIEGTELKLYVQQDDGFAGTVIKSGIGKWFSRIAVSDFDLDGDFDAIAISGYETLLIVNNQGVLSVTSADSMSLPNGARDVTWVDYDNDGYVDLHFVPHGIYQQDQTGNFSETGLLQETIEKSLVSKAICNWFDINNDGTRDVVCAENYYSPKWLRVLKKLRDRSLDTRRWTSWAYLNEHSENNWIEIDLITPAHSRSPIGSVIELKMKNQIQRHIVGMYDGALMSQGHYRIYAGLGAHDLIDQLTIVWPNGQKEVQKNVPVNRLLKIIQTDSEA